MREVTRRTSREHESLTPCPTCPPITSRRAHSAVSPQTTKPAPPRPTIGPLGRRGHGSGGSKGFARKKNKFIKKMQRTTYGSLINTCYGYHKALLKLLIYANFSSFPPSSLLAELESLFTPVDVLRSSHRGGSGNRVAGRPSSSSSDSASSSSRSHSTTFFSLHFFFYGSYLRPPPNQGNSNAQIFAEAEINVRGRKNGVGQLRTEMLVSIRYL